MPCNSLARLPATCTTRSQNCYMFKEADVHDPGPAVQTHAVFVKRVNIVCTKRLIMHDVSVCLCLRAMRPGMKRGSVLGHPFMHPSYWFCSFNTYSHG